MRLPSVILGALVLLIVSDFPLPAQYPPGGYPPGGYPGGGYPPGQYPGGIGGIPFPRRGKKKSKTQQEEQNLQQVTGMLRKMDAKTIVLEAEDTRILNMGRSKDTKFLKNGEDIKPDVLKPGDHLSIEFSEDDKGFLSAVHVMLEKEGTAEERAEASAPVETSVQTQDRSSDDERPVQRRKDSPAEAKTQENQNTPGAAAPSQKSAGAPPRGSQPSSQPAGDPANLPPIAPPDAGLDLNHIPASTHSAAEESADGRPELRRGKPAKRKSAPQEESSEPVEVASQPVEVASNAPPDSAAASKSAVIEPPPLDAEVRPRPVAEMPPPPDPRIQKATAAAVSFTDTLPNYVCQEQMARFVSETHKVNWQPIDIVSTEVVYEDHHEHYRNIQINGKAVKKRMEELPGAWSTGEFGTVLMDLFSPATAAEFRKRGSARTGGRDAFVYDFHVDHPHSHWNVMGPSQSVTPEYKGSVWIDKETERVLRIEMEAQHLPEQFPFDKVESATDYEFIRIGDGQFLLPVHAETLACQRDSNNCSHNVIDFRNYHKYSGEATIEFGK